MTEREKLAALYATLRNKATLAGALAMAQADYIAALIRERANVPKDDALTLRALDLHIQQARGQQADWSSQARRHSTRADAYRKEIAA